ncbi:signal peptidase I [Neorhodopirellula pilleata]|uniref:Signal peptidase I n=1 Tax=Neorhodopirellula pilleata TaxID=2714738 RepID=A0A5C6AD49_9BACT|nr:signal peptidase I [Neorhodopirellula pilleata]TWT97360.1 Signal peptidase I P [Neorhodopirellula pilleata]
MKNESNEITIAPRSPIHAIILSLVLPGLGHWYCGRFVAGLAWALATTIATTVALGLLARHQLSLAWLPVTLVMTVASWDAWRAARQCPSDYRLRVWNRWDVYLMLVCLCSVGSLGFVFVIKQHYVEAFVLATDDMHPTMTKGERVLVNKTAYRHEAVQRGDVIAFAHPEYPKKTYMRRVVAMPGDEVEIHDGQLRINGESVESYANADTADFGPLTVPRFNCFVLGDNCNESKDSRHFGPVPIATVGGKVSVIFFPRYQRLPF